MELAKNLLDDTNSNHEHTEQVPPGDESDAFMEVTPTESAAVPTAEEMSLQEAVNADPKEASETPEPEANKEAIDKALSEEELANESLVMMPGTKWIVLRTWTVT